MKSYALAVVLGLAAAVAYHHTFADVRPVCIGGVCCSATVCCDAAPNGSCWRKGNAEF